MANKVVLTDQAPVAIGPYSQAVSNEKFLFVSGQLPIDPITGELVTGDIAKQTQRVLQNVQAILKAQGLSVGDIVKVTTFLTQMEDYQVMNEVYADMFGEWHPARSVLQVAGLPKEASIEVEAIATFPDSQGDGMHFSRQIRRS